jgi:hypothetical protein
MRSPKRNNPRHADSVERPAGHHAAPWLLACLWMLVFGVGIARAQTTLSAEEKLERDFTDPLSTLPQLILRDSLPPMSLFVTGQWMVYREFAPVAPQTMINFGLTVAFPQLQSYCGN